MDRPSIHLRGQGSGNSIVWSLEEGGGGGLSAARSTAQRMIVFQAAQIQLDVFIWSWRLEVP